MANNFKHKDISQIFETVPTMEANGQYSLF